MKTRAWILYDERACNAQGTDEATVLVACDSETEAVSYKGEFGAMACYSYAVHGKTLTDEQWEWDYQKAGE
jgi:hypothetical protein